MNARTVLALVGGLVLGAAGLALAILFMNKKDPSVLKTADAVPAVAERVSAWGRLAPQSDVIPLSAAANQLVACVEELLVAEGDPIVVGQPIAILDSHARRKSTVEESKARLASAEAKLNAVRAAAKPEEIAVQEALIEGAKADFDEAKEQYDRGKSLSATNSISAEEQASRNMRFKKSNAALNQARRQLESLRNPRAEDIAAAVADVKLAEASLNVAQADLDQSVIRSPIIGQVLQVHVRQGQKIGDKGVVDIGDTRTMHAIAEVYEEDVGRIALGQKADVFVPSLQTTLKGRVERISRIVARKSVFSNDPVEDTDARVIEVRIALDTLDSQRVSGLSNARIHARIEAPVLATPVLAAPVRPSTSESTIENDLRTTGAAL